mgnify:CR=1 FL=1
MSEGLRHFLGGAALAGSASCIILLHALFQHHLLIDGVDRGSNEGKSAVNYLRFFLYTAYLLGGIAAWGLLG